MHAVVIRNFKVILNEKDKTLELDPRFSVRWKVWKQEFVKLMTPIKVYRQTTAQNRIDGNNVTHDVFLLCLKAYKYL